MSTLIIDDKEYVVMPKKEYEALRAKAAAKAVPARKFNLKEGKKLAYQMIDKWAKEK